MEDGRNGCLARALARAKAAWPSVEVSPTAFAAYVAQRIPRGVPEAEALPRMHLADLYLACACAHGDPRAMEAFESIYLRQVDAYLARGGTALSLVDDVRGLLRGRLFGAADGGPRKIEGYGGRGPLGGWLRMMAVRAAIDLRRDGQRLVPFDRIGGAMASPDPDPEIECVKARSSAAFRAALEHAVRRLATRERSVLRMHFLDGVPMEAIAAAYRVHRTTVVRWIADARRAILEQTSLRLREQLGLAPAELDSMMALVQSRLDVSLRRILDPSREDDATG